MPSTSRAFVKASVLYLILGAMLGALLFASRWVPMDPRIATLKVSHVQFLVVGWLTQLILGVAWWLFPPLSIGLRPEEPQPTRRGQAQRGREPLFWATFILLNAGILLRAFFDPVYALTQARVYGLLTAISGLCLLAAAMAFVANMWGRVRELGRGK